MGLHTRSGGIWQEVKTIHTRVSGVWQKFKELYVRDNGTWRLVAQDAIPIPEGLIVALNSTSIPSGWTRYSAADGRFIVGAGSSYPTGSTGGSWTGGTLTTSSDGAHAGDNHSTVSGFVYYAGGVVGSASSGAHTHTVVPNVYPQRQSTILIKAGSGLTVFPANSVVFATGALTGPTTVYGTNGAFLLGSSGLSHNGASATGSTPSSAGSHSHGSGNTFSITGGKTPVANTVKSSGAHANHSVNLTFAAESIKKVLLRALTKTSEFGVESGIIGLWDGGTIPSGWTEQTSFRDYFININSAGTGSVSGNNTVRLTSTLSNGGISHDHYLFALDQSGTDVAGYAYSYNNTHNHTIDQWVSFLAPYLALRIIKYTG